MRRRRAAAAADKTSAGLDETLRERRHVLGRAHVKLPPLNVARQPRVRLRGQVLGRNLAHLFESRQDVVRAHAAVQADDVRTEFVERRGECFGCGSERRFAVHLDGHLGDDRQVRHLADRADRLFDDGQFRERLEYEQIDPALGESFGLLFEKVLRLVERRRSERLDAQAQRPDRTRDIGLFAGRFACDAGGGDVDVAKLSFEPVRLQFVPRGSERVRFDDVGTRFYVLVVHLADEVGRCDVQLVVAAVYVHAFVVKACPYRAVKDIHAVGF